MNSRKQVEEFITQLEAVVEGRYATLVPCDPPPWKSELSSENMSFVLAALADENAGSDSLSWATDSKGGWAWLLHHEASAGSTYFARMEACNQSNPGDFLMFWLGIRAGFQGKYFGDPQGLEAWMNESGWATLPLSFPALECKVRVQQEHWRGSRRAWWIPSLAFILALFVYKLMALKVQGGL
jgi:type VI protein secretion system component VasF